MESIDLQVANSFLSYSRSSFLKTQIDGYKKEIDKDELEQMDALLRYHFKVNPDELEDEKYYKLAAQLTWVIEMENSKYKNTD